jgi:hypothetical protein
MVSPNEDRATCSGGQSLDSRRGFGFESGTAYMGFIANRLAMGLGFLRILRVSAVSIIPPVFHIDVSFSCQRQYIILAIDSAVV